MSTKIGMLNAMVAAGATQEEFTALAADCMPALVEMARYMIHVNRYLPNRDHYPASVLGAVHYLNEKYDPATLKSLKGECNG